MMQPFFIHNNQILASETDMHERQQGRRNLGVGLFETLKYKDKKIVLAEDHFDRMWEGMHALEIEIPKLFTPQYISNQVALLAIKNHLTEARVRISIYRKEGGMADSAQNRFHYLIENFPLPIFQNFPGKKIGIYPEDLKPFDRFSKYKLIDSPLFRNAALYAAQHAFDDVIVLNQSGRICETTIANIFVVKNKKILTPSLSEGPVGGILRKFLLNYFASKNMNVEETQLSREQIFQADEVFLTNSIRDLQSVYSIDGTPMSFSFTEKLIADLKQEFPVVFSI